MRLASSARTSGFGSRQPASTWSCTKRRRDEACWLAPRSWTSIRVSSPALTSPSPGMHFQVRIPPELGDLDQWGAMANAHSLLGAAIGTRAPAASDQLGQLLGAGPPTQRSPQV